MEFEIREMRPLQERWKLTHEREESAQLMDQGLSSMETCRPVGINYWVGKRWRNGSAPNKAERRGPAVETPLAK
ncbi:hypothetical protein GCM10023334_076240 [Nonomuraea thailandensis]